jgi:uncharacterized protein (DUF58 family)
MDAMHQALIAGQQAGAGYHLTPPRRAATGVVGLQVGNRPGSSLDFLDHREYQPGDDLRRIDWSAYARTDKLIVKLHREEVSPHLDVLLDTSRSMALADSVKPQAAVALAAMLCTAAGNGGCSHAVHLAGAGCTRLEGSSDLPSTWTLPAFDHDGPLDESILRMPPRWRSRAMRVLISDLLWMGDPSAALASIAGDAVTTVVVQVLARADVDPPQRGNVRLVDSETGELRELFIDAAAQRRYRDALARHEDAWRRACRQYGAVMVSVVAEPMLESWDLSDFVAADVLRAA